MYYKHFIKLVMSLLLLGLHLHSVAQDKYKAFDKENKGFTFQIGVNLSTYSALSSTSFFSTDPQISHIERSTYLGEGLGIHTNFIFKKMGFHTEIDFFLDDERAYQKFKKFDIGPIFKVGKSDISIGVSLSRYVIFTDVFDHSDRRIGEGTSVEKSPGFFLGIGTSFGGFRINGKYIFYQPDAPITDDNFMHGFSFGIGASL